MAQPLPAGVALSLAVLAALSAIEPAAEAKRISADAASLNRVWDNAIERLPELARLRQLPTPAVADLTLPKALAGRDLRLQLLVWNNRCLAGRGWVENFDALSRPVGVLGEALSADGATTLRLTMPVFDSLADGPFKEKQLQIEVVLSFAAAKLTGRYAMQGAAAAKGELTGLRHALPAAALRPPAFRAADGAAEARQLLADSANLLRLYRTIDILLTQSATPADAWAAARVVAPDLLPEEAAKPKPPLKKTPDLPTLHSEEDTDLGGGHRPPSAAPPKPSADPTAIARLPAVAAAIARIRELATSWAAAIAALPAAAPGAQEAAADPEFGPWCGNGCLPADAAHANVLPENAGAEGPPSWLYVDRWQYVGPFPLVPGDLLSWSLPEFIDAPDAQYPTDLDALKRDGETGVAPRLAWQSVEGQIEEGLQRPWYNSTSGRFGGELKYAGPYNGCTYARAELRSPKDVDLWVALSASDSGRLWVNGQPVAAAIGEPNTPGAVDRLGLGKASLRKGANTLIVRLDARNKVYYSPQGRKPLSRSVPVYFWVKLAVNGKPLDAAAAKARQSALAARQAQIQHVPPNIQAYRNNNVACYAGVRPVTAWDIDSNTNVLWRAHMELESAGGYGSSAASSKAPPVVMGEKLIVLREPHFIRCLDKMTGKVLWDRECNVLEFTAPDKLDECRRLWDAYDKARARLLQLGRRSADREAALVKRGMSVEQAAAEMKRLAGEFAETAGSGKKADGNGFFDFLARHGKTGRPCYGAWTGFSYASPVTDGKRVWVKFATGVAACFDAAGNRAWMVKIPAEGGNSVCPSPILVDGKFIVEVGAAADRPGMDRFTWDWTRLIALDADTGKELWRSEPLFHPTATSSSVAMKITNGREDMSVIVTDGAAVVRVEDGKVLSQTWLVDAGQGSPTVAGQVVYHPAEHALLTASSPIMYDRDNAGLRRLWSQMLPTGFDAGMAYCDGLLYGSGGGQGPGGYLVFDPQRRAVLRCETPGHGESSSVWRGVPPQSNGRQYVPITVAGEYVFIGEHGSVFHGPVEKGGAICGVVQRNPRGLLVGKSLVEKSWTGPPVFDGDRIYIRTDPSLICVGYTGDAGRAYEADVNARYMLGDLETQPPTDTPPIDIAPVGPGAPPRGTPFTGFLSFPIEVFGYFSIARADEVLAALDGLKPPAGRAKPLASVEVGGETITREAHANCGIYGRAALLDKMHFRDVEFGKGAYFRAMLANDRPRIVRVWAPQEPPDVWINGMKVPEGARVRLRPGTYCLTARAFHTKEWPVGQGFYFRLDDSSDVAAEHKAWQEMLRTSRPELERIAKYARNPAHVERAKKLLAAIETK